MLSSFPFPRSRFASRPGNLATAAGNNR
jgi:hypothetical protein